MLNFVTQVMDWLILGAYLVILWKVIDLWWHLRPLRDKRREARLTAVLMMMAIGVVSFVIANLYFLRLHGETLFTIRVFQIFVVANGLAYWWFVAHLKKEVEHDRDTP